MLRPGERVYRVAVESWENGRFVLRQTNFVRSSKNGWHRYRNLNTGEEWNERGLRRWHPSRVQALEHFVFWALLQAAGGQDPTVVSALGLVDFILGNARECFSEYGLKFRIEDAGDANPRA